MSKYFKMKSKRFKMKSKLSQKKRILADKKAIKLASHINASAMVLKSLSLNVTSEDRQAAEDELGVSKSTQSRYLNGNVKKINVAVDLIRFYKNQIRKRKQAIRA